MEKNENIPSAEISSLKSKITEEETSKEVRSPVIRLNHPHHSGTPDTPPNRPLPNIWIIRSSYIRRGEEAAFQMFGENFGLNAKAPWFGKGAMHWKVVHFGCPCWRTATCDGAERVSPNPSYIPASMNLRRVIKDRKNSQQLLGGDSTRAENYDNVLYLPDEVHVTTKGNYRPISCRQQQQAIKS